MAMSILLLILGIPEALIFSIPARIPIIRQRAMSHSVFRWVVIVLLSVVVTFVNYLGWIEVSVKEEIIFSFLIRISDQPLHMIFELLHLPKFSFGWEEVFSFVEGRLAFFSRNVFSAEV